MKHINLVPVFYNDIITAHFFALLIPFLHFYHPTLSLLFLLSSFDFFPKLFLHLQPLHPFPPSLLPSRLLLIFKSMNF